MLVFYLKNNKPITKFFFKEDRFNETVTKNLKLKEKMLKEINDIDDEYEAIDDIEPRDFPCSLHQEPQCESCFYDRDEQMPLGQTEPAQSFQNVSTQSSNSADTSIVSMSDE